MIRKLNGKSPKIHKSAFIAENAYIVGDIEIGKDVSIWPGAVIRSDSGKITIGEGTNIQDNSVIHSDGNAEIQSFITIGHGVICHAKFIGKNTLLGNGCIVNNDASVGENSLVASGSVITNNAIFEPNSLIRGVPGKKIGRVTEKHIIMINSATQAYIKRIPLYTQSGLNLNK
ncbi:MAG: gamma carbonic anhydrase family protein [Chloroflexi bacterium]|nr:gamma carbonic anhydrase family protein [Chloroflexota bacterium]MBL01856.1 gamma carbonic anhydrase family protein [Chloroflexota bacterium]|tara:strand:- start:10459 stop:10977 length:519 start_codon:yes stop_codon:yes gene_type:complete